MATGTGTYLVSDLLTWVGAKIVNEDLFNGDPRAVSFSKIAALGQSQPGDLAFFFSKEYLSEVPTANPGVLVIGEPFAAPLLSSGLPQLTTTVVVSCPNPYLAMALISGYVAKDRSSISHLPKVFRSEASLETIIHPTAVVDPTAKIGNGVRIGPYCVIERDVTIGDGCVLYPSVFIGPNVSIGENGVFFPHVTLYEQTLIGNRARIHASVVIGADGFGYAPLIENGHPVGHQKIYHLGRVVIGDDVEIGPSSTIDRGTIKDTLIGSKVKMDDQCHIGHNCVVEEGAILCGGVMLAGGSMIGRYVYMGGMSAVGGHYKVGDQAKIAAMSGVGQNIPPKGTSVGAPGRDHRSFFRIQALLNRMLEEYDAKKKSKRSPNENNSPDSSG